MRDLIATSAKELRASAMAIIKASTRILRLLFFTARHGSGEPMDLGITLARRPQQGVNVFNDFLRITFCVSLM